MFNADIPSQAELPSSAQLLRSTILAAATAAVLLVTTVLPAEYGIDPTGVGRALGLAQMGEIKKSLADEEKADKPGVTQGAAPVADTPERRSDILDVLFSRVAGLLISPAAAATPTVKSDEVKLTLAPNEGAEVKAEMRQGARVSYVWKAEGGTVNYDVHGEPFTNPNKTHSYKKDRGVAADEGEFIALFDGNHGWFWRNRGSQPVTVTLRASGDYQNMKRMK